MLNCIQNHRQKNYKSKKNFMRLLSWYQHELHQNITVLFLKDNLLLDCRYWMIAYNQHWFEILWRLRRSPSVHEIFKKEFQISPEIFEYLINPVVRSMVRQNTFMREAIVLKNVSQSHYGVFQLEIITVQFQRYLQ